MKYETLRLVEQLATMSGDKGYETFNKNMFKRHAWYKGRKVFEDEDSEKGCKQDHILYNEQEGFFN